MAFTQRSEATRNAILAATRKLLAERGHDGTTIRAVAATVGVDPSMVMRYYGNKSGLFKAAIDLDLRLDAVPPPPRDQLGEAVVRHFLARWEGDLADEAITLLLRSACTNPVAAEHLRTIFDSQVAAFIARVARRDPADGRHRAGLVSTQLLGLALTRYVVAIPPVVEMDTESVVSEVGAVLQHYLTGELGNNLHPVS